MHAGPSHALAPLELSHVYYDPTSRLSQLMAILTLSPILVVPAYLSVFVFERELVVLGMLGGQLVNEGLSWGLKEWLREERPYADMDSGYASPSSHAQFFGYLLAYLAVHLIVVQRAPASWPLERRRVWGWKRAVTLLGVGVWSLVVCFSRWYLKYHTPSQITLGFVVGVGFALVYCTVTEVLPRRDPAGLAARARRAVLRALNVGDIWGLEVADRWAGGREGWEKFRGIGEGGDGRPVGASGATQTTPAPARVVGGQRTSTRARASAAAAAAKKSE